MPASLLARTFLLIASLVLATTVAWLSILNYYEAEPRARQVAELAASAVNTVRAALIAAAPSRRPTLFNDLSRREGIGLLPAEASDKVASLPDQRYWRLLDDEILLRLGPRTRVAQAVNDVPGLWVSFRFDDDLEAGNEDEEFWIMLPLERAAPERAFGWLLWGIIAFALSLAVAGYIARRIARPLQRLASAANALGRGQTPESLPEDGPHELQQLAANFNRMAHDLAAHEAERAEVLAGISHDLRTPLTRLRLEAEMSIANDAARDAAVADIAQMESVISQFLDYARGDAGEAPALVEPAKLLEILAERQRQLGRSLQTAIGDLPQCALRPKAFQRAAANLLENAYKYGAAPVVLEAEAADGWLVVRVTDGGPGIPENEIERLKRPFTRLESARTDVQGTGLGLAIVERVSRLHGGRFELRRAAAGGLQAELWLPLTD